MRRWPRSAASAAFARAAVALTSAWFLPSVLGSRDPIALALYILLPAAAAAIAGALLGAPLCDPSRSNPAGAVGRGAVVASISIVVFAPLFATLFAWTTPGRLDSIAGTAVGILIFSAFAFWWMVALVGGVVGWALRRMPSK